MTERENVLFQFSDLSSLLSLSFFFNLTWLIRWGEGREREKEKNPGLQLQQQMSQLANPVPNRPIHNNRALQSVVCRFQTTYNTSIDGS